MFQFIHAADIHLDSPLRGLERYEGAPVDQIRSATRLAFENMITLAIERRVEFVLIAGDLFDGDWKDFNTGLFFTRQMGKLKNAGIQVAMIAGNHDADNKMTRQLKLPDNVHLLPSKQAGTVVIGEVAIHGQSFATAAVTEDLSLSYPAPRKGLFNIGLLHTCVSGRPGHAAYAPCTVASLSAKGYDYWALGHVHNRETLSTEPHIVFPGNIQGRHIRETGEKGCVLVTVDDNFNASLEFEALDVLRWHLCRIDASDATTPEHILAKFSSNLLSLMVENPDVTLAVRVEVTGSCSVHGKLQAEKVRWIQEIRSVGNTHGNDRVWIEKVLLNTEALADFSVVQNNEGPLGELDSLIAEICNDGALLEQVTSVLSEIKTKLPPEAFSTQEGLDLNDEAHLKQFVNRAGEILRSRMYSRSAVNES